MSKISIYSFRQIICPNFLTFKVIFKSYIIEIYENAKLINRCNLITLSLVFVPFEFRKCIEGATFKTTRPYFVQYFWVWSYYSTVVWDIIIMTTLSIHTTAMQEITNTKMTTEKITTKPVSEKYVLNIYTHLFLYIVAVYIKTIYIVDDNSYLILSSIRSLKSTKDTKVQKIRWLTSIILTERNDKRFFMI